MNSKKIAVAVALVLTTVAGVAQAQGTASSRMHAWYQASSYVLDDEAQKEKLEQQGFEQYAP